MKTEGAGKTEARIDRSELVSYALRMVKKADPIKACNQDDATGFIRFNALRLKPFSRYHAP